MTDVSVLCPPPKDKAEHKQYRGMMDIVHKVVVNAAIHRSYSDMMLEVYLAGLWHGVKLNGPLERARDYIDIAPPPKRSGRVTRARTK